MTAKTIGISQAKSEAERSTVSTNLAGKLSKRLALATNGRSKENV